MNNVDALLSSLDKVRKTGAETWLACCPAHADRNASLSIRETADGRVLIHCFAGCSAHEVLAAVDMDIADLFPARQHHGRPERRPFPAMDALRALAFESLVVATVARSAAAGNEVTPSDAERAILASSRILAGLSAVAPDLRGVRHG
jgi:hypothetical protein